MSLPVPATFYLKYVPPTKEPVDEDEEGSESIDGIEDESSDEAKEESLQSEQTSFINTSRPATQYLEDSSFKNEYQSDMDKSLVTLPTLDALREP